MEDREEPGRRERKKAATRLAISNRATELFVERGFEAVTVAEVAEAADVSIKTVFNHFATKEDLFFDRVGEVLDVLDRAILERPGGATPIEALHRLLADQRVPIADGAGWELLDQPRAYELIRRFTAAEHASPALRARRLVLAEDWTEHLARTFTAAYGLGTADDRPRVLAAMVMGAMGLRERALSAAVMDRLPAAEVEAGVRRVVDEAFGRIERAFADLEQASGSAGEHST